MTTLRRRRLEDLQLRGLAPRTPPCDVAAVKQLTPYSRRAPDQSSEDELRQYVLFLINDKKVAERTCRIHRDGIRCFYERTRQRPWPVFDLVRPRPPQTRPVGLSLQEVRSLLALVEHPKAQMGLQLIYACGLRLTAGTHLQVSDIEAQRMRVRGHQGTGGQDRLVPLAPRVLEFLRAYWQCQRPRPWLFPARDGSAPLSATSLQKTCKAVVRQRRLSKDASLQTLRHSSATPRLERGVSRPVMQARLSHRSPRTTARSTPLTPPTLHLVHATITALMAALCTRWITPMPPVADVFRRSGGEDLERCGQDLLPRHRRAMDAMLRGRTEA